jgi:hypothetical protein
MIGVPVGCAAGNFTTAKFIPVETVKRTYSFGVGKVEMGSDMKRDAALAAVIDINATAVIPNRFDRGGKA